MSLDAIAFVVSDGAWGIFTSTPRHGGVGHQSDLEEVHIYGLASPIQFVRVTSRSVQDGATASHLVVSAYPPFPATEVPELIERMHWAGYRSGLSVIIEDTVGWARALPSADGAHDSIAAVIAYSKASGGWDDSNPIFVEIEGTRFSVTTEYTDEAWQLVVQRERNEVE